MDFGLGFVVWRFVWLDLLVLLLPVGVDFGLLGRFVLLACLGLVVWLFVLF